MRYCKLSKPCKIAVKCAVNRTVFVYRRPPGAISLAWFWRRCAAAVDRGAACLDMVRFLRRCWFGVCWWWMDLAGDVADRLLDLVLGADSNESNFKYYPPLFELCRYIHVCWWESQASSPAQRLPELKLHSHAVLSENQSQRMDDKQTNFYGSCCCGRSSFQVPLCVYPESKLRELLFSRKHLVLLSYRHDGGAQWNHYSPTVWELEQQGGMSQFKNNSTPIYRNFTVLPEVYCPILLTSQFTHTIPILLLFINTLFIM